MRDHKIAIIGLGYVGLPLAVEFAKKYQTYGFDINENRIIELRKGNDTTLEVTLESLMTVLNGRKNSNKELFLTNHIQDIEDANIYIITVPTPINDSKQPDLTPLLNASKTVGGVLSKNDIIIYESTVYPGVTEEVCVPILEQTSGLKFNIDFYTGYSPERINPGDKNHTITKILKVTSGSTKEVANIVDDLYASIIEAGTHKAPSIKVAEAAKVIENSQRDINIAFINELSKIFRLLDIDTKAVLEAAGTKWNFLKFTPGLVGGHCIGVDPFYLAEKAKDVGYNPEIILAGRKVNDSMGSYVAQETVKLMVKKNIPVKNAHALVLGITFKENCPDVRNSRVIDIINELKTFSVTVDVFDPWASVEEVDKEYDLKLLTQPSQLKNAYSAIIIAVSHNEFLKLNLETLKTENSVVFDVKSLLPLHKIDGRL